MMMTDRKEKNQAGGGIHSIERAQQVLDAGAKRVIIGSALFSAEGAVNAEFAASLAAAIGAERVVAGIDTKNGKIAVKGWKAQVALTPDDAIPQLDAYAAAFLYTHVDGEGTMHGVACSVVRPVRNGYLLVFEAPKYAAAWAKRLQFEVQWHNEKAMRGRAGVASRPTTSPWATGVSRVLRAHGYDCIGGAIDDCIELAAKLRERHDRHVPQVRRPVRGPGGQEGFRGRRRGLPDPRRGPEAAQVAVMRWTLLDSLSAEDRGALISGARRRRFAKGEVISSTRAMPVTPCT